MNRTDMPDIPRASDDDRLLRRYHEASALNGAQPAPSLRAAVLAEARAQAARTRPAANDAQWRWRALGSLAVLGLVGLLVLQFDRGSDTERERALGRPGTSTGQTAPPVLRAPEPQPPGDRVTRTAPSAPPVGAAAQAPAAISVSPIPAPSQAQTPSSAPSSRVTTAPIPTQTRRPAEAPAPASSAPDPFSQGLAVPRATGSAAEPAALAETAPVPPQDDTHTAAGNANAQQAKARSNNAPLASATPFPLPAISAADRALLRAAAQGSAEDARAALAQGAQINATQEQGRNALMLAALRGDAALVRWLLDAGAHASHTDRDGQTAADLADLAGHRAIASGLRNPRRAE